MAGQNNVSDYATAIQAQLTATVPTVPVYASFNRNFAAQQKFITWNLRNVHQDVYTGSTQSIKGIDRPIFQVNIYSGTMQDGLDIANTIIQALHGYSGFFGGSTGFYVSKIDIDFLYNTFDNDIGLHSIYLDCTMDLTDSIALIPTPSLPTLNLNFLTGTLDSRITFSRASNATLTGSNGLIQYAPNNLITYSQDYSSWNKTNGSITSINELAPDGSVTASVFTASAINAELYKTVTLTAGFAYTSSIYLKRKTGTGTISIRNSANTAWIPVTINSSTYTRITNDSGNSAGTAYCDILISTSGDAVYVWGAQLNVGSLQPYYPTTTAAYYGPRFDYDPITLACKGLLIEEQRVNLLTYSEQFDNAAWTKIRSTVLTNSTTAPDGTLTADSLIEDTSSIAKYCVQTITTISLSYTFSTFIKANTRTWAALRTFDGATDQFSYYDLTNGTLGIVDSNVTATITSVGNGWYRCTQTRTLTAGSGRQFQILISNGNGTANTYTGDGTSGIYIWGAQLEAGAFATSYIPTVASQVTRTADNASMTGTNFSSWYNQSEGTLNTQFIPSGTIANNTRIVELSGGTSARVLDLYISGSKGVAYNGTTAISALSNVVLNTDYKLAAAYKTADYAVSSNGTNVVTAASALVNTANTLYLGKFNDNTSYLNGTIKSISYYPRRLTNQELIAITA